MMHSIMLKKNPKGTWNLLRQLVPGKSKQNKFNFQNPTISASTFNNFFATAGEKTYCRIKLTKVNGFVANNLKSISFKFN